MSACYRLLLSPNYSPIHQSPILVYPDNLRGHRLPYGTTFGVVDTPEKQLRVMGELMAALLSVTEDTTDSYKLDVILGKLKDDGMNTSAKVLSTNFLDKCKQLLQSATFANKQRLAEILAELGKFDCSREACVNAGLIGDVIQLIQGPSLASQYHGLRALGNICYENTPGKRAVLEMDGSRILAWIVKHVSSLNFQQLEFAKIPLVTIGCLWNVSDGVLDIQKEVIRLDVIPSLEAIFIQHLRMHPFHDDDDDFMYLLLSLLSSFADIEEGNNALSNSDIPRRLMSLLTPSEQRPISDDMLTILEILTATIQNEKTRSAIVDCDFMPRMLSLLAATNHTIDQPELCESLERLTTDIIVLTLGFDDTIQTIYHGGDCLLLDEILTNWLPSSRCQLQVSGALAIGNIARSDDICVTLVASGFLESLIDLLTSSEKRDPEDSVKIQESTLSTLRNLAIPVSNKTAMLEQSIIPLILPYLRSTHATVRYKVLAILRIVIEKQEDAAKDLGCILDIVHLIVQYCTTPFSPGELGEASRLLASLVRNSKSNQVMDILVLCGGANAIIKMVSSQHPIMQNEAITAMAILCTVNLANLEQTIMSSDLVRFLGDYLQNQEHGTELKMNALSLVNEMRRSDVVKADMVTHNIVEIVKSLIAESNNNPHLRQRAISVSKSF